MSIFERATRLKLRFLSSRGPLSVEELWDLPLTSTRPNTPSLDGLARAVHRAIRDSDGDISFVNQKSSSDDTQALQLEILKSIIATRQAENQAQATRAANSERRQALLAALEERQKDTLKNMSEEEIQRALSDLA